MGYTAAKLITTALKNGSSANMAVNGSSTPQVFTHSPGNEYDHEIQTVCLIAETSNALAFGNKFIDSTIATLANGLLIEGKCSDIAFTWQNCKRTRDLFELATAGGLDVITGTPNVFHCHLWLPERLTLAKQGTYTNDDYLRVTVRDDLRAITYMEVFLQGVKI